MIGVVGFENLEIECIIGVHAEERSNSQKIYVDFKGEADFSLSAVTDDLQHALDYFSVAQVCSQVAQKGKYFLLEKCANDILQELVRHFGITWGWIKIKKNHPFPAVEWTFVELEYGTSGRKR